MLIKLWTIDFSPQDASKWALILWHILVVHVHDVVDICCSSPVFLSYIPLSSLPLSLLSTLPLCLPSSPCSFLALLSPSPVVLCPGWQWGSCALERALCSRIRMYASAMCVWVLYVLSKNADPKICEDINENKGSVIFYDSSEMPPPFVFLKARKRTPRKTFGLAQSHLSSLWVYKNICFFRVGYLKHYAALKCSKKYECFQLVCGIIYGTSVHI